MRVSTYMIAYSLAVLYELVGRSVVHRLRGKFIRAIISLVVSYNFFNPLPLYTVDLIAVFIRHFHTLPTLCSHQLSQSQCTDPDLPSLLLHGLMRFYREVRGKTEFNRSSASW